MGTLFGKDYDSVQIGESKALPSGGYICRIIRAQITTSSNHLPMVEALIDICDGEYSNYFSRKFDEAKKQNTSAPYPYNGRVRVVAVDEQGMTKKTFKGFCTAVEDSNGISLPREDGAFINALSGKLVGVIFGREEFKGKDGKAHWATKPRWYRSVEAIQNGDYEVPNDVFLNNGSNSYNNSFNSSDLFGNSGADSFSAAEDDIPF